MGGIVQRDVGILEQIQAAQGSEFVVREPVCSAGRGTWIRPCLWVKGRLFLLIVLSPLFFAIPALAQTAAARPVDYRSFFGLDSRTAIWMIAEIHLMFGAFVLGVPIFALIVEIIGAKTKDHRYDNLAREFVKLLVAAFSTTASLGGLLVFALFGLYPKFMGFMTGIFGPTMYVYGFLFFVEAFSLYLYYYSWDRLADRKALHIGLGVLLNLSGILIMMIANSWATYMMSPTGIDEKTGQFIGTLWQAVDNPLWNPVNIHRFIANVAFGGFIAGAYAAIKFLGARSADEQAHYDWMGYIGNFVGIAALIPLPFAGYYLGREVYSASPVMGNNMMGGAFSWTFIIQALLIGMLFIGANFYLWNGMERIPGAERYTPYIKWLNLALILSFVVWLTPHNLPLSSQEQILMGGQYHPVLKYLGLMPAKNAVVNFIILSTLFSFLLYRRGNKGKTLPISAQGRTTRIVLAAASVVCILILYWYADFLFRLEAKEMDLPAERASIFRFTAWLLVIEMVGVLIAAGLTFWDRGVPAQFFYLLLTAVLVTGVLGVYGFVVLEKANPFLRNIAVVQVLMVLTALILGTTIDVCVFRNAEEIGQIAWGKVPARAQYTLVLLCVSIVMLMGLMGFIRSGLREDWHIYGAMRDTSAGAFTPTMAYMSWVVGAITIVFLGLVAFVFWLASLGEAKPGTGHREMSPAGVPAGAGGEVQ
ncbi:MAG: cytochrome ubiquinol oxidase subunit I [Nitrospinota bacterium]